MKLPIPALVSIGHRISGLVVFLFVPLMLCALDASLKSESSFIAMQAWFQPLWVKALLWIFIVGLVFHLLAGMRHLLMDCHIGESLKAGRIGAMFVLLASAVLAILAAWCIRSMA